MSINQYIMNSLLDNQKVKKRKFYGQNNASAKTELRTGKPRDSFRGFFRNTPRKPAFRPAGIISLYKKNSRLIENIRQDTVFVHQRQSQNPGVKEKRAAGQRKPVRKFSILSLPAAPAAAVLLLALGGFFMIQSRGAMDWTDREVVNSEKDQGSQHSLAVYAGINQTAETGEKTGEAIPLDLTETFAWQSYKVKKGDSVSKIASSFSVSMDAIIASNGITNARGLREGEVLRIPNMDGIPYTVKNGDSLSRISLSMGVPMEAILDANDIQSDVINTGMTLFIPGARMKREDLRMALGELFIYPVKGAKLSSPFGWRDDPFTGVRRHHAALDLSAPQGTAVKAAMEGRVSGCGFNMTYGNFIILSHPGGFQTMYAHLHTVLVKKGEQLAQGTQIGTVGNTGYSTGPHLHFAVFRNNRAVNPLDFLNPRM